MILFRIANLSQAKRVIFRDNFIFRNITSLVIQFHGERYALEIFIKFTSTSHLSPNTFAKSGDSITRVFL